MATMNLEFSTYMPAAEPKVAAPASNTTNSPAAFSDYLQQAQSPSTAGGESSGTPSGADSSAAAGAAATGTKRTAGQPSSGAATGTKRTAGPPSSTSRPQAPAADAPSADDPSSSAGTARHAVPTSQENQNGCGDNSGSSSNQDSKQSSDSSPDGDSGKPAQGGAKGVVVDIGAAAAALAATLPAAATPASSNGKQAPAEAKTNPNDPGSATTQATTVAATAANAQAAPAGSSGGQATTLPTANPAPPEGAATTAPADRPDASQAGAATSPKSTAADAANGDPLAGGGGVVNPVAVPGSPHPRQSNSPRSPSTPSTIPGANAAATNQPSDAAAAAELPSTGSGSLPASNGESAYGQAPAAAADRAKAAVAALSNSNNSGASPTPQGSASSATAGTAAATTISSPAANGTSGTAQAADAGPTAADRARFVQRVEQAFQGLGSQGGSVRLQLSPPELGALHIDITVAKGVMSARVQAETPAARNVLLDNLPALRERLAQHDIKIQRFDVDLMDGSRGGMSNQSSQYQQPSRQNFGATGNAAAAVGETSAANEAAPRTPVVGGGLLNVVV